MHTDTFGTHTFKSSSPTYPPAGLKKPECPKCRCPLDPAKCRTAPENQFCVQLLEMVNKEGWGPAVSGRPKAQHPCVECEKTAATMHCVVCEADYCGDVSYKRFICTEVLLSFDISQCIY